ncbi:hypothetical protein PAXINDRAFT_17199 [Paxillus involutus ATCC 200175]|uniref:F-box domain-containing protein n=1 Tax=Paxillus involutus ATCC 200175 TaxID=664439 RepID=A0A0C9TFV8_PAXIN|nr:hypothetical protein PAXINDRAFT_17199 [Paxillus involutus ATCC 200175]
MGNSISRDFFIRRLLPTDHAVGRKRKAVDAPLDEPSSKRSNLQILAPEILLPILKVSLNAAGRKRKAVDALLDEPPSKRSDLHTLAPETLLPTPELASNTTTFPQALKRKREDHAAETTPFKFVRLEDGKRSSASTTFPFPTHASDNVVIPALGTITVIQSLFYLPNELLHGIVSLLGADDLQTCTKVSTLLRDIAGPAYLAALNFTPTKTPYWLSVNEQTCLPLLVWRRLASFTPPKNLYFSSTQDHHLRALDIFIRSPQVANIPAVYLSCYGGSISMAMTATVLAGIQASGSLEITYSSRSSVPISRVVFPKPSGSMSSQLESFSTDTNAIFSPPIIRFTINVLHNSPLKELCLKNTGLCAPMWGKLLHSLDFPYLRTLKVDSQCPLKVILEFLRRHHRVEYLDIAPDGLPEQRYRARYPLVELPGLCHIGGPPAYASALGRHLQNPGTITSLSILMIDVPFPHYQLSSVLDCTDVFPGLYNILITFHHSQPIPTTSLLFPSSEARICRAQHLRMACRFGVVTDDNDGILKHCGSWLMAFPEVNTIKLMPNNFEEAEEIRNSFMGYAAHLDNSDVMVKFTCARRVCDTSSVPLLRPSSLSGSTSIIRAATLQR